MLNNKNVNKYIKGSGIMKLFKNIDITKYMIHFIFIAPALYFILGVIFAKLNWNPIWILIIAILNTIINWLLIRNLDKNTNE